MLMETVLPARASRVAMAGSAFTMNGSPPESATNRVRAAAILSATASSAAPSIGRVSRHESQWTHS